jgi:hypothetical protein
LALGALVGFDGTGLAHEITTFKRCRFGSSLNDRQDRGWRIAGRSRLFRDRTRRARAWLGPEQTRRTPGSGSRSDIRPFSRAGRGAGARYGVARRGRPHAGPGCTRRTIDRPQHLHGASLHNGRTSPRHPCSSNAIHRRRTPADARSRHTSGRASGTRTAAARQPPN